MAEYLSGGASPETTGLKMNPIEGVPTSTAGFIGLAEKGPDIGPPQLVTSFKDFVNQYGGYLPADKYGTYRFLAYAVEQFFANGGTRAFIMRVVPKKTESIRSTDFIGTDNGPGKRTGIQAFLDNEEVSVMAIPGVADPDVQLSLIAHCESLASRFAILDFPQDIKNIRDIQEYREVFDTSYAAIYHPWLQFLDSLAKKNNFFPPSGSMAGIYARTDGDRGVHKAPANEVVRGCTGLSISFDEASQANLNPRGINLIRSLPGQGIRVWGSRTLSSDGNWKYINVRRNILYIRESIKANTRWAASQPNDEALWQRIKSTVAGFLTSSWKNGALAGSSADEAFYVNIGNTTMTQDDINNRKLIYEVGIALVRPAEFIIFRMTQKTGAKG